MCNITKANELFMKGLKATAKYEEAMTQAKEEADAKVKELESLIEEPQEVTIEDVEFGLAYIDEYRGEVLDITMNANEWINEHIKVSDILGDAYETDKETIDYISKELNISKTKARNLIIKGLGIRRGSEYQNEQKEYVNDLIDDFKDGLYDDLEAYLKKAKLYDFYKGLLEYVKGRISLRPLSVNEDELTFFVVYDDLRATLKYMNVVRGTKNASLENKLTRLCDLGLLDKLTDKQIREDALIKSNKIKDKSSKELSESCGKNVSVNRKNFYVLNDLSPSVQEKAIGRIKLEKEIGLRQKDKDAISRALAYGIEEVQGKIVAQKEIKISASKQKTFKKAAENLLNRQHYFTEDDLRKEFIRMNHNYKKKEAEKLTRKYLAGTIKEMNCIKVRVNSETRENLELPKKIKSNSFIYVLKEDK